jgi:hypothetical protein
MAMSLGRRLGLDVEIPWNLVLPLRVQIMLIDLMIPILVGGRQSELLETGPWRKLPSLF